MEKFLLIRGDQLVVSPTNPRKHFPEDTLNELAASIKGAGIIEPLVVRPLEIPGNEMYEIVCGERRYRAGTKAEIEHFPCMVRQLTDDQVFEIQITENLQREDVNPLDEAEAYLTLMNKKRYGLEELATRFGKSTDYIFGRMRLANLIPAAKKYLEDGILPVTAAIRISLLGEDHQAAAIKRTILPVTIDGEQKKIFSGLRDLKSFTDNNVLMPLKLADFDITDEKLLPCGSCEACPKRTGNNLYKDFSDSDRCLDSTCYKQKHIAHYQALQKRLSKLHRVTIGFAARQYGGEKDFPELDVIPMLDWSIIDEKDAKKTKNSQLVIFVGPDRSRTNADDFVQHAWVKITDRTARTKAEPAPSKEDKEKEKVKREREALKEVYYIESLFEQFKDAKRNMKGIAQPALLILISRAWNDVIEFPQSILLDIVKRYNLTIKCHTLGTYEEVTIDKATELNPDIGYSIDVDEVYDAVTAIKDVSKLEKLLNELVALENITRPEFISFYDINEKAASKNATALLKQRVKEKV